MPIWSLIPTVTQLPNSVVPDCLYRTHHKKINYDIHTRKNSIKSKLKIAQIVSSFGNSLSSANNCFQTLTPLTYLIKIERHKCFFNKYSQDRRYFQLNGNAALSWDTALLIQEHALYFPTTFLFIYRFYSRKLVNLQILSGHITKTCKYLSNRKDTK